MSLLFMEGCDGFTTLAQANRRGLFSLNTNMSIKPTGGRWGGGAIQVYNGEAKGYIHVKSDGTTDELYIGFAYMQSVTTSNMRFSLARGTLGPVTEAGTTTCFNLYQQNGQQVDVYNAAGTKLGFFAMPLDGVWHWWSIHVSAKPGTDGLLRIFRDGNLVFFAENVNMAGAAATGVDWVFGFGYGYGYQGDNNGYFDDFVICDGGGTDNNTLMGDCRIITRLPTSLDSAGNFLPNTGTFVEAIDDPADDDDTTYISSSTTEDEFYVGFDNLPVTPSAIMGVKAHLVAKKTGAELTWLTARLKSGTAIAEGTGVGLSSGYGEVSSIFTKDPATDAQWTLSAVNAVKLGGYIE